MGTTFVVPIEGKSKFYLGRLNEPEGQAIRPNLPAVRADNLDVTRLETARDIPNLALPCAESAYRTTDPTDEDRPLVLISHLCYT